MVLLQPGARFNLCCDGTFSRQQQQAIFPGVLEKKLQRFQFFFFEKGISGLF
jgi:hypothetical protein